MDQNHQLDMAAVRALCRQALAEDIGTGDATTLAVIPEQLAISCSMRTREACVVAGLPVAAAVFHELDARIDVRPQVKEGDRCAAGTILATVCGDARGILTGERAALNFLQRLCGIATVTRQFVDALGETRTRVTDTRKTTPCLRVLEKYAVAVGGGVNHRRGLYDQILIKDNHLALLASQCGSGIRQAIAASRAAYPGMTVEIEVESLEQLEEALTAQADMILLDNMSTGEMIEAVALRDRVYSQALLEASGGIRIERIPEMRAIGLDFISVGALTHSPLAIDIGLDYQEAESYP